MTEELKKLKRDVQRKVRQDKEKWLGKQGTEAEEMNRRGFGAGVFRKIRELTSEQKIRRSCIMNNDGTSVNGAKKNRGQSEEIFG